MRLPVISVSIAAAFLALRTAPRVDQIGALATAVLRRLQHGAMSRPHRRPARLAAAGHFRSEVGRNAVASAGYEARFFGRRHRLEMATGVGGDRRRRRRKRLHTNIFKLLCPSGLQITVTLGRYSS